MTTKRRKQTRRPTTRVERQRYKTALGLCLSGMDFAEIAKRLRYADAGRARCAVKLALKRAVPGVGPHLVMSEVERLNQLLAAVWARALDGEEKAIDRALKIMTQRSGLLGFPKSKTRRRASSQRRGAINSGTNVPPIPAEDTHDIDQIANILHVLEEVGVIPPIAQPVDEAKAE